MPRRALEPAARRAEPRAVLAEQDRVHLVVCLHRVAGRPLGARRQAAPRQAVVLRARLAAALPALGARALLALAVAVHAGQRCVTLFLQLLQIRDPRFELGDAFPEPGALGGAFPGPGALVWRGCVRRVPHARLLRWVDLRDVRDRLANDTFVQRVQIRNRLI